ncbi:RagB/SusD family nutrient uptake outer membrane protein [Mucilaginibacter limnophilus]|nr:RagB/SusD family nutrient uptake outer membrane protein [Mucilaginibacter limnophilus]
MKKYLILLILAFAVAGCKKFLDAKPDGRQILPEDDLQNLQYFLDDTYTINQRIPSAGEVCSDNIYFTDELWQGLFQSSATSANLYIWSRNVFNDNDSNDWTVGYKIVFNANVVLDAIDKTPYKSAAERDDVKGQALFFRALAFYHLLQEFAKPYNPATASADKGIVLRLSADISKPSSRASLAQSYEQVIADLQSAVQLLRVTPKFKSRPSKTAALGLLSRVYLATGDYINSLKYANDYLTIAPELIDYNTQSPSPSYPFPSYNKEVTFDARLFPHTAFSAAYFRVNSSLFNSYAANDLRRTLYFQDGSDGNIMFRGSYYGSRQLFGGIATDEIYLNAAESSARVGNTAHAMALINELCEKRYRSDNFTPFVAADSKSALEIILAERRKELAFRNLRWMDIRRLSRDPDFAVSVSRTVSGTTYELPAGSEKLVLPIPQKVIDLGGIEQN